jgi:membrane-associated phospholipid phosphatase
MTDSDSTITETQPTSVTSPKLTPNHRVGNIWRRTLPEDWGVFLFVAILVVIALFQRRHIHVNEVVGRHYIYFLFYLLVFLSLSRVGIPKLIKTIRHWIPIIICTFVFGNLGDTIHRLNPHDKDSLLDKIDTWMFLGVNPALWLDQHAMFPWLMDLMQSMYTTYYLFGPLTAAILFLRRRWRGIRTFMLAWVLASYVGFLGYVAVPALGPRYYLVHEYQHHIDRGTEVPFTQELRRVIDRWESNKRDVFPSLHTALTLIPLLVAWRYERKLFWLLMPFATGILLSTVYCRYHYVIDVIAGIALAGGALWAAPRINRWWERSIIRGSFDDLFPDLSKMISFWNRIFRKKSIPSENQ